ncbi:TetR/AcrR family transcriptional regulator [Caldalkalibacillus salinus]|uniref:TetR/AcrR family transcriptional regulator n=1 Tax=Caldalkalibacillus salinus TaxID=2803787 RepID=UPI001923C0CD|nr:TetR/AcrR family transcriptional regulator [Caldalkalibacillus salinus]
MSDQDNTRDKILKTSAHLFRRQGYHATGLNQIIKESGAPKGSLYYYFPSGKEELAVESVSMTKDKVREYIKAFLEPYSDPVEAIQTFFIEFQKYVNHCPKEGDDGAPIGLLALETSEMSDKLKNVCDQTYTEWQAVFKQKLIDCGVSEDKAADMSLVIMMLIEGGVTLSTTNNTRQPFEVISKQIPLLLNK